MGEASLLGVIGAGLIRRYAAGKKARNATPAEMFAI